MTHLHIEFEIHEGDEEAMHNASDVVLNALEAIPGCKVIDAMYGDSNVCVCEGEAIEA